MEWALLGTQVILILLALRGVYMLVEIRWDLIGSARLDRATSMLQGQIGAVVKELRKIEDRIATGGHARWYELERIRPASSARLPSGEAASRATPNQAATRYRRTWCGIALPQNRCLRPITMALEPPSSAIRPKASERW